MEPQKPQQQQNEGLKKCEFYVQRKRRYCKFKPMKGSKFCAAHCSDLENKVQCPYEKGMFIDAAKMERHLQICPMMKNKKEQQQKQWFNKGVNLENKINPNNQNNQQVTVNHILQIPQEKLMLVIKKLIKIFTEHFKDNYIYYLGSTPEQKIDNLTNDHIQANLLAVQAHREGLIRPDIIYLQFGAGKGILSYAIANKVKQVCKIKSKNVLLEREARRNKFDRFMKDNYYFQRYRSDVSDFDMQTLPTIMADMALTKNPKLDKKQVEAQLNDQLLVGTCKHMCGGALDISVRSLLRTKISGCILASCCHHLCSFDTYLNNKFLEEQGLNQEQIQILFKISSWGTRSGWLKDEEINIENISKIQYSQLKGNIRIIIGRMSKRLIDLGRAKFLKAELVRYCSDQVTPENFVILSSLI